MARRTTADEKKLVQIIQQLPFNDEDKTAWVDTLNNSGLNEEIVRDIQVKVVDLPKGSESTALKEAQDTTVMMNIINRWRLNQNLRNLKNRRR